MSSIGIGIIGGGYMGKAHAVAYAAVGAVFATKLRPRLEMVAASSITSAQSYQRDYGFARATDDWRALVNDPAVDAVIIASPPEFHKDIALAAFALGKPVFCEKPLGATLSDAEAMAAAAENAGAINMIGFNYIRTPACQYARQLITEGVIGDITYFRGEHTEDFDADPQKQATWRSQGRANGALGDLAPHIINATLALVGEIGAVSAVVETVHAERPDSGGGMLAVTNDDQAQFMCRFASGAMGHLFVSRVATGRKMGYAFEITGTKGAIRFDMEDQNAIWLYKSDGADAQRGFTKILTGPYHPDYLAFCQGPGHGTGYQDQIIIEARDFLQAIETGTNVWPSFADGLAVSRVVEAVHQSNDSGQWVTLSAS